MLPKKDIGPALLKLILHRSLLDKTLGCNGNNFIEFPMDRARKIGEFVEEFYLNIELRRIQFDDSKENKENTEITNLNGDLLDLFERDKSQNFVLSVADYLDERIVEIEKLSTPAVPLNNRSSIRRTINSANKDTNLPKRKRRETVQNKGVSSEINISTNIIQTILKPIMRKAMEEHNCGTESTDDSESSSSER
jgi:hypothetical protein